MINKKIDEEGNEEFLADRSGVQGTSVAQGRVRGTKKRMLIAVPDPALKDQDRLSLKLQLYHQGCCSDPVAQEFNSSELLQTREQPYVRLRLKVKPDWLLLDLGWLAATGVGVIALENAATLGLRVQPTEAQKAELAKMVILLKHAGTDDKTAIRLRRNEFTVGSYVDPTGLVVKSEHGVVDANLYVIPK